jgi:hypothetical protein
LSSEPRLSTGATEPGLDVFAAFYADGADVTGEIRPMAQDAVSSVAKIFALTPVSHDEAVSIVKKSLADRVLATDEEAIATLVVRTHFCIRHCDRGDMLTLEPIGGLSSLESELCVRATGLGAWIVENTSLDAPDGECLPLSTVLALCGLARGVAILTSMIQLTAAENFVSVGVLSRTLTELAIYVTYLLRDGDHAINTLASAHKWQFRDVATDPYLAHLDLDPATIVPKRANFRAILDHLQSLGPAPDTLADDYYRWLFGFASHSFTHTSLLGLLQHIATDQDGRQSLTLTERESGIETTQAERTFVGATSVTGMLVQLAPHLESDAFDALIVEFRRFALEVVDAKATTDFSTEGQASYREAMENPNVRATWGLEPMPQDDADSEVGDDKH